jgi:pimeloyl-ACP methyl ester carboxylesterase
MLLWLQAFAGALPPTMTPTEILHYQTADGWRGEIRHYAASGPAVVLVHGLGANHYNWDYRPEISLAAALQSNGWDVYIPALRGDPDSTPPSHKALRQYDFDDFATLDLPAAVSKVQTSSGQKKIFWVGHSMGGMLLYAYLSLFPEQVQAGVAIAAPVIFNAANPIEAELLVRLPQKGRIHADALASPFAFLGKALPQLGRVSHKPNMDPAMVKGLARAAIAPVATSLARQGGRWYQQGFLARRDGSPWLSAQTVPVLAIAGDKDQVAPTGAVFAACRTLLDCSTWEASPGMGTRSYGHIDLVLGMEAGQEIYPRVLNFLNQYRLF